MLQMVRTLAQFSIALEEMNENGENTGDEGGGVVEEEEEEEEESGGCCGGLPVAAFARLLPGDTVIGEGRVGEEGMKAAGG
ncbi:rho guanine nucleotide exchange factor 17 isoform X2 [Lates japonicus]|uniref:Rho guanine nucleotide exchange factor 17 isoform X2 n=1 Tax=Lates japonicus TaxID=270547 RepID=A0AAD3NIG0_LATJO|nr:rho guanine nucleotide exchange factor 17 isoform X2 [Lates japonicus]